MRVTQELHEMGQSLWLDNITRGLLASDTLRRYIQAADLQREGTESFVKAWKELLDSIGSKGATFKKV